MSLTVSTKASSFIQSRYKPIIARITPHQICNGSFFLKNNPSNGTNTIYLTDPTIRPIDETTVNGANNTKVQYEVIIIKGKIADRSTITVPVLYNGYLGKDLEYDATYIEDCTVITVTGPIGIVSLDDSTSIVTV